jgi:hypothetical protein
MRGKKRGQLHCARELVQHLKLLRDALMNGDDEFVDSFFHVYCFSDAVEFKRKGRES